MDCLSSITDISELTFFSLDSVMILGFFLPPKEKHAVISFKLEIHIEKILQHMPHFFFPPRKIDSILICTGFMKKVLLLQLIYHPAFMIHLCQTHRKHWKYSLSRKENFPMTILYRIEYSLWLGKVVIYWDVKAKLKTLWLYDQKYFQTDLNFCWSFVSFLNDLTMWGLIQCGK